MALALLDFITPWRRDRVQRFLTGPGDAHTYMVRIGVGWALARLRRRPVAAPTELGRLLGWLAIDGFGFHEGYFSADRYIRGRVPPNASGYARRVFDQGLGRSIWFVDCGDAHRIGQTIAAFDDSRHADLWSGVGLASAYAGGATEETLFALRHAAAANVLHLAQGVAFATKARQRAGNPAPATDLAAKVICGLSAHVAAEIAELALADCGAANSEPDYEAWRRGIRTRLARIAEGSVPSWIDGSDRHNSFVATPHGLPPSP
jgi:enediyne biosynthesis protein E3